MTAPGGTGVRVVVLNWRNGPDTVECLDSLYGQAAAEFDGVVLCDNASGDDSLERVEAWAAGAGVGLSHHRPREAGFEPLGQRPAGAGPVLEVLHLPRNLGYAGGNNAALRWLGSHTDYRLALLLNNDTLVRPGAVSAMAAQFDRPGVGLCGATVVYAREPARVQARGGARYNRWLARARHLGAGGPLPSAVEREALERELDYVLGAAVMVSRALLERVGPMDERYFLYYEEIDWATRARRAGFRLAWAPEAVIAHKEGATVGSSADGRRRSLWSEYHLVRSSLLYTAKFHPVLLPGVWVFALLKTLRAALRGEGGRARVRCRAMLGLPP